MDGSSADPTEEEHRDTTDSARAIASFGTTWCRPLRDLRVKLPFVQRTKERLAELAAWQDRKGAPYVRVGMIARERALKFFGREGGLEVNATTASQLAPEGTSFLAVTYGPDGPEVDVAAVAAFVPVTVAAVYVPLLAAAVVGKANDGGSWTGRGLGQLLLFLVRQFAGERTIYWQATEKARPYYEKLSGEGDIFASIMADGVTLPEGIEREENCTPMQWTSSIVGSETVRAPLVLPPAPTSLRFCLEFPPPPKVTGRPLPTLLAPYRRARPLWRRWTWKARVARRHTRAATWRRCTPH